jgi:hypothetical protein
MISEEEFKASIKVALASGCYGCTYVPCVDCLVSRESCGKVGIGTQAKDLFQAYIDGKIVIVDREWCLVEED